MASNYYSYDQKRQFENIFGKDLHDYWMPFGLGFDILKFTDDIRPDHYEVEGSLGDFLQEKYGIAGRNLIEDLIGHPRTQLAELAKKQEKSEGE